MPQSYEGIGYDEFSPSVKFGVYCHKLDSDKHDLVAFFFLLYVLYS